MHSLNCTLVLETRTPSLHMIQLIIKQIYEGRPPKSHFCDLLFFDLPYVYGVLSLSIQRHHPL